MPVPNSQDQDLEVHQQEEKECSARAKITALTEVENVTVTATAPMTSKALTCAWLSPRSPNDGTCAPRVMDPVCPYNAMSGMAGSSVHWAWTRDVSVVPDSCWTW